MGQPPAPLDYKAYLDFLQRYGHNFIRLYVWEQAAWFPGTADKIVIAPHAYLRTGPGHALDDGLRFDLTQFNPDYFRRLHDRVEAAAARRIYVSIMLFNGWSIELKGQKFGNPWRGHPFNRENNINEINGDVNGDGDGKEVHTLMNPAVTALQKAYLGKVVETLGDLDNVLWEISNESHPASTEWQYEMIRTIKRLESASGKRHPVGMTSMWPEADQGNAVLFASPADWISPHSNKIDDYEEDPPASTGRKVILSDTDHIWGVGGNPSWVWKSFLRGLNPLFMDPYVTSIRRNLPAWPSDPNHSVSTLPLASDWEKIREAMGYARSLADRMELAAVRPMSELVSTGYCLADPGKEYLIYVPSPGRRRRHVRWVLNGFIGERVEVNLTAAPRMFDLEWVDTERGVIIPGGPVMGGRQLEFRAPFIGDAVLHLKAQVRRQPAGSERVS